MSTNGTNTADDVDMAEYDGQKVVTMMDVLQEQQDFEDDANAVLGASDEKNCTYSTGYIKRQAIYACMTCCPDAKKDSSQRAGVCLACSINCHENHDLVELYTKRNFRCDCGNPKFSSNPCHFTPNKTDLNEENIYNQNFSGLYCICHRPYPDPEAEYEDEMIQCVICEDWLHSAHLEAIVPNSDQYSEMICKACMEHNEFLHDYSDLAVNVDNGDVDILSTDSGNPIISAITCNGDINTLFENDTKITAKEENDESVKDITEPTSQITDIPCEENMETVNRVENEITKSIDNTEQVVENKANDDSNTSETDPEKTETNLEDINTDNTNQTTDKENVVEENSTKNVHTTNTEMEVTENNEDTLESATKELSELTKDADSKETQEILQEQDEKQNVQDMKDNSETNIKNDSEDTESKLNENSEEKDTKLNETTNEEAETKLDNTDNENTDSKQNIDSEDNIHRTEPDLDNNDEAETKLLNDDNDDSHKTEPHVDNNETSECIVNKDNYSPKVESHTDTNADAETKMETETENINGSEDMADQTENTSEINDNNETLPTEPTASMDQENKTEMNGDANLSVSDAENKLIVSETIEDLVNGNDDESKTSENDAEINENNSTEVEKQSVTENGIVDDSHLEHNDDKIENDTNEIHENGDEMNNTNLLTEANTNSENKRKHNEYSDDMPSKKLRIDCKRPKGTKKIYKGATFWPSNFRQKLCTCNECLSIYKDLNVLFLVDPEDTVSFYEALGQERNNGSSSQYEKGLEALSSLDRIQQINAMTEYNKLRDKLLDYFKSFKDRKEVVKEEDIKAFFAGMKPRREPDGVYFCR